jgi:hypothetical protein
VTLTGITRRLIAVGVAELLIARQRRDARGDL